MTEHKHIDNEILEWAKEQWEGFRSAVYDNKDHIEGENPYGVWLATQGLTPAHALAIGAIAIASRANDMSRPHNAARRGSADPDVANRVDDTYLVLTGFGMGVLYERDRWTNDVPTTP